MVRKQILTRFFYSHQFGQISLNTCLQRHQKEKKKSISQGAFERCGVWTAKMFCKSKQWVFTLYYYAIQQKSHCEDGEEVHIFLSNFVLRSYLLTHQNTACWMLTELPLWDYYQEKKSKANALDILVQQYKHTHTNKVVYYALILVVSNIHMKT